MTRELSYHTTSHCKVVNAPHWVNSVICRPTIFTRPALAVPMDLADSLAKRATALSVSDVASLLNISERQVYKLAAEGRIPLFQDWKLDPVRSGCVSCVAAAENGSGLGGHAGTVSGPPGIRKLAASSVACLISDLSSRCAFRTPCFGSGGSYPSRRQVLGPCQPAERGQRPCICAHQLLVAFAARTHIARWSR